MFWLLIVLFIAFIVIDALLSAAVIFHLYQYTMEDWTIGRTVAIVYAVIAIGFLVLAIISFSKIPFDGYEPAWRDALQRIRPDL